MARRLKVAHIITKLELGGAQQNTLYCCAHHDREKYEVILIAGAGGYLDEEAARIHGCKTYRLPELKHPIRPWSDLKAFFLIAAILREERVDLVHTHSSKAGILGRWAARWARIPFIIHTVHGWGFHKNQFPLIRWTYQLLEKRTAPITDILITVSEDNKREGLACRIGNETQYRVIHSGIEPKEYRLPFLAARKARSRFKTQGLPCVLVLSNFKKQKSPFDVVEIADALRTRVPYALFLWAGDGPLFVKVEAEIKSRGLGRHFILLGWRKDIAELLAACDVLLLASIHEGLPRVVLQAMAAGKPVVATAVNGTPEAVRQGITGFLHEPHDTEGMAASLGEILAKPALARKMGSAGSKALRGSFLIREMLSQIEQLYDELAFRKK
jgi:glycosyltransferase involved in cell wall biosynthesis